MDEHPKRPDHEENPYSAPNVEATSTELPLKLSVPLAIVLLTLIVALFFVNIGLGIFAVIVAVPAYVRAVTRSWVRAEKGETLSTGDRVLNFLGSLMVVLVCAIAGGIAFFATCLAGLMVSNGESVVLTLSASAFCFLCAAGVIFWAWWPRRRS